MIILPEGMAEVWLEEIVSVEENLEDAVEQGQK